jgi:ABC-2 type transport system ATP-binding protein
MHVRGHKKITRPVFSVGVRTVGGIEITNPNSREGGAVLKSLDGEEVVDLEIPRLLLLPGAYDVSATATDHSATRTYDHHQRILRFDVEPGKPHETTGGVVSFDGNWRYGS